MLVRLITALFGSRNQRVVKRIGKTVARINALEDELSGLADEQFAEKTQALKARAAAGERLDDLLPEAFALVREAGRRTLSMRHFDVQLIGGAVLHQGRIAEMRTGEGKTLVATLSAYLNALSGRGVHIVTVNDYLARRDADWMGKIYRFLGLSTGVIVSGMDNAARRTAYLADITYGTNNEFGFDYLRDNMKFHQQERVQRGLHYAIVDEVDSILIDEARTPLIISGAVDDRSDLYVSINRLIPKLTRQQDEDNPGDYTIDEKSKQAFLTEAGHDVIEELLVKAGIIDAGHSLYEPANIPVLHHLNAALRAHALYSKDVDYIVANNEVVIVDEFTGRTMPGRRWSEGLHQAIEAKEGVAIQNENQTLATITYQNYFRLYDKLSGMTGTADTEAFEFQQIYGLEVIVMPTHLPMVRDDQPDAIFLSAREKFNAIIGDIKACHASGQPVLVGTASIEVSEHISGLFKKDRIRHEVLNAKFHAREAEIIAQAGKPGAITIATNMAGRGTDIVLGGNLDAELKQLAEDQLKGNAAESEQLRAAWQTRHDAVVASGGLHIIGTERHESRRIDNQLRGRAGRQGDPGSSRFYLSLEDNLMRIFASERVSAIMQKLGMEEGEAIESNLVSRAIENAQRKVEAHNFDIRKNLLEYDDVANDQRKVVYEWRNALLEEEDISADIRNMRSDIIKTMTNNYIPPGSLDELWDIQGLTAALEREFALPVDVQGWLDADEQLTEEGLREKILAAIEAGLSAKEAALPAEIMRRLEKDFLLDVLDRHWKEHLMAMDSLRQGIGLRGYAAKNPKQEYKREAFAMFGLMLENIKQDVISILAKVHVREEQDMQAMAHRQTLGQMQFKHPTAPSALADQAGQAGPAGQPGPGGQGSQPRQSSQAAQASKQHKTPFVREHRKIGRNEPCPCGSGKKYKQCHGRLA